MLCAQEHDDYREHGLSHFQPTKYSNPGASAYDEYNM